MRSTIKKLFRIRSILDNSDQIDGLRREINSLRKGLETDRILMGRIMSSRTDVIKTLHDAEFKVFSQWGDDGIIQYLVRRLDIPMKIFVEFGVGDYREANTRFLLLNDNWSGLVVDCSEENVAFIRNDDIYWKHDLTAITSFVTAENINQTLAAAGCAGEIGLLHIDVDGNDYWIWKAVEVIDPVIAIIEYNSLFGSDRAITIPYVPAFSRFAAHHSGIYAGASLAALCDLATAKGYAFVGSNSAGNNAYFARKDRLGGLKSLIVEEGYVASRFREHRDETGRLTNLTGHQAIEQIRGLPVFNTRTNQIEEL